MSETPHALSESIVVGYDGSAAAGRAVAHAAHLARPGTRLVVVFGYGSVPEGIGQLKTDHALDEQERHGHAALGRLTDECGEDLTGIDYETEVRPEPAAQALVEAGRAHGAEEIVVGTRGFGDPRSWLGSVAHELLRIADRPVVVVPPAERAIARPAMRAVEPHPHRHPSRFGTPS